MEGKPFRIKGGSWVDPAEVFTFEKFRKRPVVIDAVKVDHPFQVETLEGTHYGTAGDYLIRGIHGEYYPCKPEIFEKTYEKP